MGLPAKRRTKQSKRERASHFALRALNFTPCTHCGRPILPHRVCPHCGYYRGEPVGVIVDRLDAKAAKRKRRHKHSHEDAAKEGVAKKEKEKAKDRKKEED